MKLLYATALLFASALCSAQALTDGELLHYSFDGNANDSSGNNYNGTAFGPTLAEDRFGNPDFAYYFDGTDDYLNFPNLDALKVPLPVSFSFWIKYSGTTYQSQVVFNTSYEENHATSVVFNAQADTGNYVVNFADGQYFYGASSRRSYVSNSAIVPDEWHHIVVIVNSETGMKIFVDCKEYGGVYSGTGGALAYSFQPGCIGRHDRSLSLPPDYFNGYIDDFRYWNRALTNANISELCGGPAELSVADHGSGNYFMVYPNPAENAIHFESGNETIRSIFIYNALGQQVFVQHNTLPVDVSRFSKGLYFVKVNADSFSEVKRVVVK